MIGKDFIRFVLLLFGTQAADLAYHLVTGQTAAPLCFLQSLILTVMAVILWAIRDGQKEPRS